MTISLQNTGLHKVVNFYYSILHVSTEYVEAILKGIEFRYLSRVPLHSRYRIINTHFFSGCFSVNEDMEFVVVYSYQTPVRCQ